jgi:hypothetical protein
LYTSGRNCDPINYNDKIDNNLPLIKEL